jgi:hypothetical protein
MPLSLFIFSFLFTNLLSVEADRKTRIDIDDSSLYASLRPCAQDRVSAIVHAQVSGCNDNGQSTSFACFCIDSSSEYAAIISTAVETECISDAALATTSESWSGSIGTTTNVIGNVVGRVRPRATTVTAAPTPTPTPAEAVAKDVISALEVFGSYCARSTELSRCTFLRFFT